MLNFYAEFKSLFNGELHTHRDWPNNDIFRVFNDLLDINFVKKPPGSTEIKI